jgi:hypothetical protein
LAAHNADADHWEFWRDKLAAAPGLVRSRMQCRADRDLKCLYTGRFSDEQRCRTTRRPAYIMD